MSRRLEHHMVEFGPPPEFYVPDLIELFAGGRNRFKPGREKVPPQASQRLVSQLKPGKRHPDTYALPLKPPTTRRA